MSQARASNSVGAAKCAIIATGARARVQSSTQSREIRKEHHPNRSQRAPGWSQDTSRMSPKWLQNGSKITPKRLPRGSWSTLGGLLGAFWRLLPLFCPFFTLQRASWNALGRLWGRKKDLLSGSWALQEESQDRFQLSWGPEGSQNKAREGPKSRPEMDPS